MHSTYRRFTEIKNKAKSLLNGRGNSDEQLINAVAELTHLNNNDIPEFEKDAIKYIIDSCRTHQPKNDEGLIKSSVNNMKLEEKSKLRKTIESL